MVFRLADYPCSPAVLQVLRESTVALTLVDLALPDQPLVAVNRQFCVVTGYEPEFALGRNCRFLQPETGARQQAEKIKEFLSSQTPAAGRFVIPNVMSDGTPFINLVYLAKLTPSSGRRLVLGSQFALSAGEIEGSRYDQALKRDLDLMAQNSGSPEWLMAGSMAAISNTAALVIQHRLNEEEILKNVAGK